MTERGDPSALRWLIGVELRNYRSQAGQPVAAAATAIGCTQGKINHLESGRNQQQPEEVAELLTFYGAPVWAVERLSSLAGKVDQRTWWAPWTDVVPDWFQTFVGLETLAESEFLYEPVFVPGLLQTENYARAVTNATPRVRSDHAERFVSFRLARAQRLIDTEPLNLHAVIGEAALRLRVDDSVIMREQYQHLVTLTEQPNVTLQVLRPEDGIHSGFTGSFAVLNFTHVRSIGYVELQDGAVYIQDPDQVRTYSMSAENLQGVALDPDESVALIRSLLDT